VRKGEEEAAYDLGPGKILKIGAPGPNSYRVVSKLELETVASTSREIGRIYREQQATQRGMVEGGCD
jgi:hypothetical protein